MSIGQKDCSEDRKKEKERVKANIANIIPSHPQIPWPLPQDRDSPFWQAPSAESNVKL